MQAYRQLNVRVFPESRDYQPSRLNGS